ncbi:MAG: DUF6442 family protein [Eubacterium sp.]|nr:DUF6442 family protein [Eubacterium sp.]
MDKAEILKKAREEKTDEGASFVRDRSVRWTYLALVLSAAAFALVKGVRGQPVTDLCATVCISVCAGHIYRYIKVRDRFYLIIAVIMALIGIAAAVGFFMEILR